MTDQSPRTPCSNRSATERVPLIGTKATAELHQGAQPPRCNPDAVYMAATEMTSAATEKPLPSGSHPYMVRGQWSSAEPANRTRYSPLPQAARIASRPSAAPGVVASSPDRTVPAAEDQTHCTVCAEPAAHGAGSSAAVIPQILLDRVPRQSRRPRHRPDAAPFNQHPAPDLRYAFH